LHHKVGKDGIIAITRLYGITQEKEKKNYNKINPPHDLDSLLKKLKTIAVVVIKNDSLLYEKYWDGYSDSS
jgi:hypothetical protein